MASRASTWNPRPRPWKSYKLPAGGYPDVLELASQSRIDRNEKRLRELLRAHDRAGAAWHWSKRRQSLLNRARDIAEYEKEQAKIRRAWSRMSRLKDAIERRHAADRLARERHKRRKQTVYGRNPLTSRDRLLIRLEHLQDAYDRAARGYWDRSGRRGWSARKAVAYQRQMQRLADAQKRTMRAIDRIPRTVHNPWAYRNRSGQFTRRRKGARRTWVPATRQRPRAFGYTLQFRGRKRPMTQAQLRRFEREFMRLHALLPRMPRRRRKPLTACQVRYFNAQMRDFARGGDGRISLAKYGCPPSSRKKYRTKRNGGNMPALNPWRYRTRSGRFTRRRKGARRSWVPAAGRARRRTARRGRRSYARMPAGLRRYLLAKMRGKAPKRRRSGGKRRSTRARYRRGYTYSPRYQKRFGGTLVSSRRRRRFKSYGGKRVLDSYGPQLPTARERRKYYSGSSASGQMTLPGMTINPRRRRRGMRRYATVVNPRRRRVQGFRRVRRHLYTRNPGVGGIMKMAKNAIMPSVAGLGGGFISGLIDTKIVPKKRLLQGLLKFAAGLGGAFLLRKHAVAAGAFVGSTIGTIGYGFGVRMGGGNVANSKGEVLAGLADMAAEDPELADLVANSENVGDLVTASEIADGEVEIADADDNVADLVANND